MTDNEIITPHDEMVTLTKEGNFFGLCVAMALNKGFRNVMKNGGEVKFSIGDYDVEFKKDGMCFILSHKIYFARIISTNPNGSHFVGDDEDEVINEVLAELEKEPKQQSHEN